MASDNMLTHTILLYTCPGGVLPELHLKKGSSSAALKFIIVTDDTSPFPQGAQCVIRGAKPDGSDLFLRSASARENGMVLVQIPADGAAKMAETAGSYRCMLTFLSTNTAVTRENYMSYDFLTVLPFTVIVHENA